MIQQLIAETCLSNLSLVVFIKIVTKLLLLRPSSEFILNRALRPFNGHTLGANSRLSIAVNSVFALCLKLGVMTNY